MLEFEKMIFSLKLIHDWVLLSFTIVFANLNKRNIKIILDF